MVPHPTGRLAAPPEPCHPDESRSHPSNPEVLRRRKMRWLPDTELVHEATWIAGRHASHPAGYGRRPRQRRLTPQPRPVRRLSIAQSIRRRDRHPLSAVSADTLARFSVAALKAFVLLSLPFLVSPALASKGIDHAPELRTAAGRCRFACFCLRQRPDFADSRSRSKRPGWHDDR